MPSSRRWNWRMSFLPEIIGSPVDSNGLIEPGLWRP